PNLTALPGGGAHPDRAVAADTERSTEVVRAIAPRQSAAPADRFPFRLMALAAAVAVLLFVGGALLGPSLGFTQEAPGEDLAQVVTAIDAIIQQPAHLAVALHAPNGSPGGSLVLDPTTSR